MGTSKYAKSYDIPYAYYIQIYYTCYCVELFTALFITNRVMYERMAVLVATISLNYFLLCVCISQSVGETQEIGHVKRDISGAGRRLSNDSTFQLTDSSLLFQGSYEKAMYSGASNFEKMMMSMSGATAISHPAIKKANPPTQHTGGSCDSTVTCAIRSSHFQVGKQ